MVYRIDLSATLGQKGVARVFMVTKLKADSRTKMRRFRQKTELAADAPKLKLGVHGV